MPIEGYPNLINPATDRTTEERRDNATKAGQASGVSRRRRKTFRESLLTILAMDVDDPTMLDHLAALGLDPTFQTAIDLAQAKIAARGDTDAARFIRDTIGEKPKDELEIGGLADRPIAHIDMSKLSDDQLRQLAQVKSEGT